MLKQLHAPGKYEDYTGVTDYQRYDAIRVLPSIENALDEDIARSTIGRGYEIERPKIRHSWLLVVKDGRHSYFERN